MGRTFAALLVGILGVSLPAAAADNSATISEADSVPMQAPLRIGFKTTRPSVLPALYVGCAILQGFDVYSTLKALKGGAVESNPMMRGAVANPIALITLKAAVTASSIYAAERLWRQHHRTQAVVLMAVSNGIMAAVAARNASVMQQQR